MLLECFIGRLESHAMSRAKEERPTIELVGDSPLRPAAGRVGESDGWVARSDRTNVSVSMGI